MRFSLALCLLAVHGCVGYAGLAMPRSVINGAARQPLRSSRQYWAMADAEEPAADAEPEAAAAEPEAAPAPAPPKADDGDDLLSSAAFLKQKLKVLEKELEEVTTGMGEAQAAVEEARSEFAQQRTRLQTDFDNFRARHYNQTIDAQVDARIKLLAKFLPVLDNFDRARDSISPNGEAAEAVNTEYQTMHATLMTALDGLDVTKIPTVGEEFDYNLHMAIQQMPSDEYEEGIVCAEMQPGYLCKGKLLRAAYVAVSA